jgi:cell division protein FtsW
MSAHRHQNQPAPGAHAANWIVVTTLILVGLGMVMAVSASGVGWTRVDGDWFAAGPTEVVRSHGLKLLLAVAAFAICCRLPLRWLERGAPLLFAGALVLTLATLVIGRRVNGASRWLPLFGQSLQPVELLKICLVLLLARLAVDRRAVIDRFWSGFMVLMIPVTACLAVTILQPDLGSGLFLMVVGVFIVALVGGKPLHLLGAGAPVLLGGALYAVTHLDYLQIRWASFVHPAPGDQISQSLLAFSAGGIQGAGLGEGWMKMFVPEARNDFIFAVVGEELGFVGCAVVVLLFTAFTWAGFRIAAAATDLFTAVVAFGLTWSIALQAWSNMAVATKLIPTKGIDLPFLSAGGTNLICATAAAGLLVQAGRSSAQPFWQPGGSSSTGRRAHR